MKRTVLSLVFICTTFFFATTLHAGGWLGVTIEPPRGVQIGEIIKGGPADTANLQRGDIIISINNSQVQSIPHFIQEISHLGPQQKIVLGIVRQGKQLDIDVTLDDSNDHLSVSQTPFYRLPNSSHRLQPFGQHGAVLPGVNPKFPSPATPGSDITTPLNFPQQSPPTSWLGIAPGISNKGGIIVKGVAANSPGQQAGIKTGDVIISINGQAVSTPASLVRLMSQFKPGDIVEVSLTRNGKDETLQVKMGTHPLPK